MRFLFLLLVLFSFQFSSAQDRFTFVENKMGSPFQLILYASDSVEAAGVAAQTYRLVDSLNLIFSDYDRTSELSRLNATAGLDSFVPVSTTLYHAILESITAAAHSNNSFDITMGPLSVLWRDARKNGYFPDSIAVLKALQATGIQNIIVDSVGQRIKLMKTGMRLDFGGYAKGFIAQKAIEYIDKQGIKSALVDAGGDIVCSNPPPGKTGWSIGVSIPKEKNRLLNKNLIVSNCSVATSGDIYQHLLYHGGRYSHIIDPRTGYGITKPRNITIVADKGALSDWLATACSILTEKEALKLVKKYKAQLLIVESRKGKLTMLSTKELRKLLQ